LSDFEVNLGIRTNHRVSSINVFLSKVQNILGDLFSLGIEIGTFLVSFSSFFLGNKKSTLDNCRFNRFLLLDLFLFNGLLFLNRFVLFNLDRNWNWSKCGFRHRLRLWFFFFLDLYLGSYGSRLGWFRSLYR